MDLIVILLAISVTANFFLWWHLKEMRKTLAQKCEEAERLNKALARKCDEIKRLNKAIDKFIHDLKSLVIMVARLPEAIFNLSGKLDLPEMVGKLLQSAKECGQQALDMIGNPFVVFRIEQGLYEGTFRKENFWEIAKGNLAMLGPILRKKELNFCFDETGSENCHILVDPSSIRLLVANLMKNAAEAAPEKSQITISLSEASGSHILQFHNKGEIPAEIRDQFWEENVTSGKRDGTGLGTYIAHRVAKFHEGNIGFETSAEKGTSIYVTIPMER